MDTFLHGKAGILYAEDFGRRRPQPPPAPPPAPLPPQLGQADIDEACIRAVQSARSAWAEDAAERRTAALQSLSAGLEEARDAAERQAGLLADGIARVALGMVAAALPELCHAHGDAEVRSLTRRLLPLLARTTPVVARVHAGLLDALRLDLADMDEAILDQVELRPANLPPGDVRLSWEDGSLVRDGAAITAAIMTELAQLGLVATTPTVPLDQPHRSLAHVQ